MIYTTHLFRHLRAVIGHNIRVQREARGLSLEQLSETTDIPGLYLEAYEAGQREISLRELLRISCALETNAPDLMRLV